MTPGHEQAALPERPTLPFPVDHPAADAHTALLQTLADHLEAGLIIPCVAAGADGNPWTTEAKNPTVARNAADACHDCPALGACAQYALAAPEPGGVWGGMTPKDRARALAARQRPTATAEPFPGITRRSRAIHQNRKQP